MYAGKVNNTREGAERNLTCYLITILFVFEIETREAFTAPYENVCAAQIQLKMEITLVQITRRIERYSNIATFYLVRV